MSWIVGGLVLLAVGYLLRRILWVGLGSRSAPARWAPLPPELHAVYHPMAQEVETSATILGISLNDAFEEREAQRHEQAWHMMRLALYQWDRTEELVGLLLNIISRHLPKAPTVIPPNSMPAYWFKTHPMIDFVRMHELMNQIVFNSRHRFQLQLRLLRRATATLSGEYRRSFRNGERIQDPSPEVWTHFDHVFHDFDLVAKETLLVFRALLVCLDPSQLPDVAAEIQEKLKRGLRTTPVFVK